MSNSLNLNLSTLIYTTGSYSNPSWLTSLDGSKLTGTITANAITAGTYNISITGTSAGAPPTGSAGGDLAGTYPNPTAPGKLSLSGGTMTGNLFLNVDPTSSTQAATKNYVDVVAGGFSVFSALAATTGNIVGTYNNGSSGIGATFVVTATGSFAIDGITVTTAGLFLFKNQTSSLQNGLWYCLTNGGPGTSAQFTRAANYNTPAQINPGDLFVISSGTVNAGLTFLETATVTTIGTDPITFSQWGGQSITLSGDVSGSGMSPVTTSIGANKVINSMIRQSGAASVIGNSTNATANVADISAASDNQILRRSGGTLAFGSIDLSQSNTVSTSILGVTNGGTGTSTSFTSGSVVFAGSSGIYNQDNTHLFYDSSGVHLYVGANSSAQTFQTPGVLNLYGTDGTTNNSLKFYTTADGFPGLSLFHDAHGNQAINFDSFWNGSTNISSYSGSNFQISHLSNQLQINYASGIVQGAALTYSNAIYIDNSGNLNATKNVIMLTAGQTLKIKQGSNACSGTGVTLSSGTATVNTTAVATGDTVLITKTANGGTTTTGMPAVSISNGVSFTLTGSSLDTSTYSWVIIKPS